jgi:FkbM family methyltransferase
MYSQNNEEEIILNYFGFLQGVFIDIGANDGLTLSNTRMLAERGWKGVLVEPSPKAYARLKEVYKDHKGVYTYPFAIGNHNGTGVLNESASLINPQDVALVSTLKPEEMDRFKTVTQYTPVEVKVFRWKTFMNRLKYKTFDFISIDAEGLDLDILKQIDLSETKMVCVEFNGKNKQAFVDACPGFRLIHENGENLIFAR